MHWGLKVFLGGLLTLGAGESVARFGLGLGTPPLFETDPRLEYRMSPNQRVWRFGNLIETNERGMRSPRLAGEQRRIVLVVGDSVPNGGSQIDQSDLATSLLSDDTTVFANLSAKSWGPANELAALRANEDLSPAAIVVVLNSDDLPDVPTFAPLDEEHPQEAPFSALWEAMTRYLPRYLPMMGPVSASEGPSQHTPDAAEWAQGRADLQALLAYLQARPEPVCLVLHPRLDELKGQMSESNREISTAIMASGLALVDQAQRLIHMSDRGAHLYLDSIHMNDEGQKILSGAIHECLKKSGLRPPLLSVPTNNTGDTTDAL